ncbi:MAG TPA: methyltransferase domain-containing protein [Pyrinomonadaceae bacterium]|nr:methyltransferase domain-containing protein [Pyrinomonadaceae bacterium]
MKQLVGFRVPETEAMDTIEEAETFNRLAERYLYIAEDLIARMALAVAPSSGTFLELCSGPARIPIKVAELNPHCEVLALDYSKNMVRIARKNADESGAGRRVRLIEGDAKKLPFKENFFDLVTSSHAIHHLADPVEFFNEVARVVKPDGAILLIDLRRPPKTFIPAMVKMFGFGSEPLMRSLYRDSLRASYTVGELNDLVNKSRLRGVALRTYFPGYVAIIKPAKEKEQAAKNLRINPFTTIKSVLQAKWRPKQSRDDA